MLFLHYEIYHSNYIAPLFGFNDDKECFYIMGGSTSRKEISTTKAEFKLYRHQLKISPEIWVSI